MKLRRQFNGALWRKFNRGIFPALLLLGPLHLAGTIHSSPLAQEAQEQEQSDPAASEQTASSPPQRVVGRAATQEELEAWQTVNQAADLSEKASLATRFLESYPDSGLTPFAHQILAENAYQANDIEEFVSHAEKSLEEIPQNPDLLTPLAFVYAEQGETENAIQRAQQSIEVLDRIDKPLNVPARPWIEQVYRLRADAYYSLGRAHLGQLKDSESAQERAQDPHLQQAIKYLTEALNHDPTHGYSQFRLGYAYTNANQAEPAMDAYARAAVIGGAAADPAREQLEAIHNFVRENIPDSSYAEMTVEEILQQQEEALANEAAARDQRVAEQVKTIEQEEAQQRQKLQQQQQREDGQQSPPAQYQPSLGSGDQQPASDSRESP